MPPRLGEILIGERACTPEAVRDALKNQVIFGGRLGTNLLEIGAVDEGALARALGRQLGLPALAGALQLDPKVTSLIPPDVADRCDAIPYLLAGRRLAVLVIDPKDLGTLDEVAFATGKQVHPIVVPEARLWALLRETYGIDRHLRGIEVGFASLAAQRRRDEAAAPAAPPAPPPARDDLIDEGAFHSLYTTPARAPSAAGPPASPAAAGPQGGAPGGGAAAGGPRVPDRPTPAIRPPGVPIPVPPAAAAPEAPSRAAPPVAGGAAGEAASLRGAPPGAAVPPEHTDLSEPDVIELTELVEPETSVTVMPEVLAALSGTGGHEPPLRVVRPPPREEPEPSPLGFDEALRVLEGVEERNAIAQAVLRYARSRFARAVLLTVHRGAARGWAGLGEKLGAEAVRRIQVTLGAPGIVDTVVRTQAHFLGPIPKTEANIRLLRALGGGVPGNALLVPILATGRVVNVFYADAGRGRMVDAAGVGELLILATRIANSYDALLSRVR